MAREAVADAEEVAVDAAAATGCEAETGEKEGASAGIQQRVSGWAGGRAC